ncbi:MAG: mevalonate kinase [Thermoplasmata archaeon]|nr:mevalonate kinase [Thermoplasmata archaeon]
MLAKPITSGEKSKYLHVFGLLGDSMGHGHGYGKVIIFGEHFVVHGLPSIVCAIGMRTTATVSRIRRKNFSGFEVEDLRPETPGYKKEKEAQMYRSISLMCEYCGIDLTRTPIKITFAGDLVAASGIGASAAACTAFARAVNEEFNLGFNDEKINEVAYEGEKGYHGTPSGVDNTASTFGGCLVFLKGPPPKFERVKMPTKVEIVMGNTGLTANTQKVVEEVKALMKTQPEKTKKIFEEADGLIREGRICLESCDYRRAGELMNRNHELLQELGVSCKELDLLVNIARENGAWGAKLTGTGRGGYMVALTPGKECQEKVARAIENAGFTVLKTTIGV